MMTAFDANAPVIVGVGEASRKTVSGEWPTPRDLAGAAIKAAFVALKALRSREDVARLRGVKL